MFNTVVWTEVPAYCSFWSVWHSAVNGPTMQCYLHCRQYRQVLTDQYMFSVTTGNNCVFVNESMPALVKNFMKTATDVVLICAQFETVSEAFSYPLASSNLNIWKVTGECANLFSISLSAVFCKCVCWPVFDSSDCSVLHWRLVFLCILVEFLLVV